VTSWLPSEQRTHGQARGADRGWGVRLGKGQGVIVPQSRPGEHRPLLLPPSEHLDARSYTAGRRV
jgi:hypothetical protein